jgi:sulfur relay (sulfurtransferase) complex TusBCD TusD component (DsrE family)
MTLLVGPGATQSPAADELPLAKRVEQIMHEHKVDRKAALKQAARERGLPKREAYKQLLLERSP